MRATTVRMCIRARGSIGWLRAGAVRFWRGELLAPPNAD